MSSPFSNSAFDVATSPMMDEVVKITGIRAGVARSQSLTVAVLDDTTGEPIGEDALDSEAETICCVARSNDWYFVRDVMVRGDRVLRADGREYQVAKVGHDSAMGWIFKARRCK